MQMHLFCKKKKLQRSLKSKAEWQWQNARLNLNNLPLIFYFSNFFYLYNTQYKEMGRFVATWQTAWWEPVEGSYDMPYFHGQPIVCTRNVNVSWLLDNSNNQKMTRIIKQYHMFEYGTINE